MVKATDVDGKDDNEDSADPCDGTVAAAKSSRSVLVISSCVSIYKRTKTSSISIYMANTCCVERGFRGGKANRWLKEIENANRRDWGMPCMDGDFNTFLMVYLKLIFFLFSFHFFSNIKMS